MHKEWCWEEDAPQTWQQLREGLSLEIDACGLSKRASQPRLNFTQRPALRKAGRLANIDSRSLLPGEGAAPASIPGCFALKTRGNEDGGGNGFLVREAGRP